jgi:Flp pilus assembly protein TadD
LDAGSAPSVACGLDTCQVQALFARIVIGNTFARFASNLCSRAVGRVAMSAKQLLLFIAVTTAAVVVVPSRLRAGDLKINIPRRSVVTPVQQLNREGVKAVQKHQYEKAETLFYKAYLYDPGDPFTLNNLGYISELQGQLDRAESFYRLASQQASDAAIDRASAQKLEGKPMIDAVKGMKDASIRINRDNVRAIQLLAKGRAPEAEEVLQQALALDPHNPYTLNNLGVTKEEEGDLEGAYKDYTTVANLHSDAPVVVTLNSGWRGKAVSKMAEDSAKKVSKRMQETQTPQAQASLFALRGVSAVNRNDWNDAANDFKQAYALDPGDAFSLNNAGYLAEMQGDMESAQFFYDKARTAQGADFRIGVATRAAAEGTQLFQLATDNGDQIDTKIAQEQALRRQKGGPIELLRRDNTPVDQVQPDTPPAVPKPPTASQPQQP